MGKKAKAKKIRREEEKQKKVKKETHKEIAKKAPKIKVDKKKLFGGIFTLIMLALLVSVGFLIFRRAFKPTPIAEYLPAERTVALMEINTNRDHNQFSRFFHLLEKYPQYSASAFTSTIKKQFSLTGDQDILNWFGRSAGIFYLRGDDKNTISTLYFADVKDFAAAQKSLGKTVLEKYKNRDIYRTEKSFFALFLDNYIIVTSDRKSLHELIDLNEDKGDYLSNSSDYQNMDSNLPLNRAAFIYLNFELAHDAFFQKIPFFKDNGILRDYFSVFANVFNAEGFSLSANDKNFEIRSFMNSKKGKMVSGDYLQIFGDYDAKLSKFISDAALVVWGGEDLEYQIKRFVEALSNVDKSVSPVMDGLLENQVKKYFGSQISFKSDVLPLLQNEYAVSIENVNGANVYKLVLELGNSNLDAVKIHDLANAFAKHGGVFEPKIVEYKLKDGTPAREIIAEPKEIKKQEIEYHGDTIFALEAEGAWGVYYAIKNGVAIIANNVDSLKQSLDIVSGRGKNFGTLAIFDTSVAPVIDETDDIFYFNIKQLLPVLFKDKPVPAIFGIIDSVTGGKAYLKDGVMTVHFLNLR